jgi:hypothetical protein
VNKSLNWIIKLGNEISFFICNININSIIENFVNIKLIGEMNINNKGKNDSKLMVKCSTKRFKRKMSLFKSCKATKLILGLCLVWVL